jgi:hypothetical protein
MDTYETIYLMNETYSLIGQILTDMLTVIFAIVAAGFIMGGRLSKLMVIGISILSTVWVMPMLMGAYSQFRALGVLAETLTSDKLGELGGLVTFLGSQSVMPNTSLALAIIGSHAATFLASLWFLNYSRGNQGFVSG